MHELARRGGLANNARMRSASLCSVMLFCIACSVETVPIEDGDNPLATEHGFCQAKAEAECTDAVVAACYGSDESSLPTDVGNCAQARALDDACNPTGDPYHADNAEACLAAVATAHTDAQLTRDELDAINAACLSVFSIARGAGEACTLDSDCDTLKNLRCIGSSSDRLCREPIPVEAGRGCQNPASVCEAGFYCDGKNCLEKLGLGEACDEDRPCRDDGQCKASGDAGDAPETTCIERKDNGQTCVTNDDCTGGFCLKPSGGGDETAGSCAAVLTFSPTGASCEAYKP